MPRLKRQEVDAAAEQVGQDAPRVLKSTGPAKKALEPAKIEVVESPIDTEWAANMKFNEEILRVIVHESTDKNAEQIVEVFNGGIPQRFIRGQEQEVKRKFVEVLARAKMTTYSQEKVRDDAGNESYRNIPHTALRYPFAVLMDPSPRGKDWLKAILAQA